MGKLASDIFDQKAKVKKKDKLASPTKIVIRRLPPTLTEEELKAEFSPLPDHDYFHFCQPDYSFADKLFSRAYINFKDYSSVYDFCNKFDGYVFYDTRNSEYKAVVELAPCQQVPTERKKKDHKMGTIEKDGDYLAFLEQLDKEEDTLPSAEVYIEEIQERAASEKSRDKVITPLIEFLKEKKESRLLARQAAISQKEKERKQRIEREKEKRRDREKERAEKDREQKKRNEEKKTGRVSPEKSVYDAKKASISDEKKDSHKEQGKAAEKLEKQDSDSKSKYEIISQGKDDRKYEYRNYRERGFSSKPARSYEKEKEHQRKEKFEKKHDKRVYSSRDWKDEKVNVNTSSKESKESSYGKSKKETVDSAKPEPSKNASTKTRRGSIDHDDPSIVAFVENEKTESGNSGKSTQRKPRPEMQIYRPPSSGERGSAMRGSDSKERTSDRHEKKRTNMEKSKPQARDRSNKQSRFYDNRYERERSDRYSENRKQQNRRHDNRPSYRNDEYDFKESEKSHVEKPSQGLKDMKMKVDSENEREREKELEQERYRRNWLGKE